MLAEEYCARMESDKRWRESELRAIDLMALRERVEPVKKAQILVYYSHWEGHFKFCATELLEYICEGVKRKIFKWTDIDNEVRVRIMYCVYRKTSLPFASHGKFLEYLNDLNESRYSDFLKCKDEIIMIDDNLSCSRAEAICKNMGVDCSWFLLKKIIIEQRFVGYRNAIAHGSRRLRTGDEIDVLHKDTDEMLDEMRNLFRQIAVNFSNAITLRRFIKP